jgi:serine phosphatase RsbU (regulator of sigma subunit)
VLIPETLPAIAGFTLTSAYKPALEVGGDFFQIIPLVARCLTGKHYANSSPIHAS